MAYRIITVSEYYERKVAAEVESIEAAQAWIEAQPGYEGCIGLGEYDEDADIFEVNVQIGDEAIRYEVTPWNGIHYFGSTGDAYDATQTDESIKTGDCLMVFDEEYYGERIGYGDCGGPIYANDTPEKITVVGLVDTWPVAVTLAHGNLHTLAEGKPEGQIERVMADTGWTVAQVRKAVREAVLLDLPLHPAFASYAPLEA